jgi:glucokinase
MDSKKYIGIDIGGTKIAAILFSNGKILNMRKIKTPHEKRLFIISIIELIKEVKGNEKISGIGVGVPGGVDRKKGIILQMPNIKTIKNLELKKIIEKEFKVEMKLENDGNCMSIAEFLFGGEKGKENLVSLTLGTGIGGGIIINKKLYIGRGSAGEMGHITINSEGYKCNCGSIGCFEEYGASRAIERFAKEEDMKTIDPLEIETMARAGDKKALNIYKKIGYYLGVGIGTIIKCFDPEVIILSGSLSHASELFLDETRREVKKRVFFKTPEIKVSKLKNSPAIGAASLFLI